MVSQKANRLDFDAMMDSGKIFLAKLPQGVIGRENAFLLGSLIMTKLQQAAMARARLSAAQRTPFYCYIDEFQHFITPSLTEILSGARKYGLGLVLAHQELKQLDRDKDVASAVLANAFTRVVFRVSDSDARTLAEGFAHFEARHLQSLGTGEAVCRIGSAGNDFNLSVPLPPEVNEADAADQRDAVIAASRAAHAIPRGDVEEELRRRLEAENAEQPVRKAKAVPATVPDVVTKSATNVAPATVNQESVALPQTEPPEAAEPQPAVSPSAGMGRGGQDHQHIVEQLSVDAARFGYRASKELAVPGGRVDITLEKRERRIAVEVAVNSNTAHEIENIQKCLAGGFDHVVSLSPLPNVIENIRRAVQRQLLPEQLARVQFHSPDSLFTWLTSISGGDDEVAPSAEDERTFGGRRVRIKHVQLAPDERARLEKEHLAAIAEILSRSTE